MIVATAAPASTRRDEPTYLGWLDDRKRQTADGRVAAAVERFRLVHGQQPAVALVHPDELAGHPEVAVRAERFVPRTAVYVGPIPTTR